MWEKLKDWRQQAFDFLKVKERLSRRGFGQEMEWGTALLNWPYS